jgi:hypothetical protein
MVESASKETVTDITRRGQELGSTKVHIQKKILHQIHKGMPELRPLPPTMNVGSARL